MKKFKYAIVILLSILGCKNAINITQPTILMNTDSPKAYDSISLSVIENADVDGERIKPEYYIWSILNRNNEIINSNFKDSSVVTWIPDSAGYYIVSLKIGYDKNKSITTLKEIFVKESSYALQRKLVGNWIGKAEAIWGESWKVVLKFDEVGHYIGKGYSRYFSYQPVIDTLVAGPFQSASYIVDNKTGLPPSEDVPCTRFILNKIIDNKGYGKLSISRETKIENIYQYECFEIDYIQELEFINKNKGLIFTTKNMYNSNNEWDVKYNLTKVE